MAALTALAGPAYLSNSAANIYVPPSSSYVAKVTNLHFCNVTNATVTFTIYVGATGGSTGGTELFKTYSLPAFSTYDYPFPFRLVSTTFLTGLASASSSVTILVTGEETKL